MSNEPQESQIEPRRNDGASAAPRLIGAASKSLGVSATTLRNYINDGLLLPPPTVERGLQVLWNFTDEYLAEAQENLSRLRAAKEQERRKRREANGVR